MSSAWSGRRIVVLAAAIACVAWAAGVAPAFAATITIKPGAATAAQFPASTSCGCHGERVGEWQESMHAKAIDDPLFKTKVALADKETGGKVGPFCRRCHAPVANMAGEDGSAQLSPQAAESISCTFCHQITGTGKPIGNASHTLEANGVYRAQIEDPQSPHSPVYSEFHTKSEICGGCHNVNHPFNGMHLESTFAEWSKSPQAEQGIQCQDCHMSAGPPAVGPTTGQAASGAPDRPNIYLMTFAGAQVALGNAERATALLESAATVDVIAPEIVGPGVDVTVTVTNVGAGHYLPTGLTEVREMWLQVVAVDGSGKETEIGKRVFGTVLKDKDGKFPAEMWNAVAVESDDRIPPMGSVSETYKLTLPAGTDAADVKARLLYKSASDEFAAEAGVENPTTTMAETVKRVFATAEAKAADANSAPSGEASASGTPSGGSGSTLPWIAGAVAVVIAGAGAGIYLRRKSKRTS